MKFQRFTAPTGVQPGRPFTGNLRAELRRSKLTETRKAAERGWRATSNILLSQGGQSELAAQVGRFVYQMPVAKNAKRTDRLGAAQT